MSCVVYASKFKPAEAGAGLRAAPVNSSNLGVNREPRKPRETITNAHDWVWLGEKRLPSPYHNSCNNLLHHRKSNFRVWFQAEFGGAK